MREPWLARWQDVLCLTVAGAFAAIWLILGDGADGIVTSPYVAGVVFVVTWVVIDFMVAYLITRRERQAEQATTTPPLPQARLPRAIARLRRAR